jgi:hypothetical protein
MCIFYLLGIEYGTQMCVFYILGAGDGGHRCASIEHISIQVLSALCLDGYFCFPWWYMFAHISMFQPNFFYEKTVSTPN